MIEVKLQSLAFDRASNTPVVILRDIGTERVLPIWIGPGEASAIAMHMGGVPAHRPLTHDLLVSILGGLGGTLRRVLITRVKNSTYFAEMIIDRDGDLISVDARPSDSIAVALRAEARIFADEALLGPAGGSGGSDDEEEDRAQGMKGDVLEKYLKELRPEDLGRYDL